MTKTFMRTEIEEIPEAAAPEEGAERPIPAAEADGAAAEAPDDWPPPVRVRVE